MERIFLFFYDNAGNTLTRELNCTDQSGEPSANNYYLFQEECPVMRKYIEKYGPSEKISGWNESCEVTFFVNTLFNQELAMETKTENYRAAEPLNILLVGNNPMEMGGVLEKLKQVRGQKIITEIAFDLKSILERLIRFHPNFIFIDDNIGRNELMETVNKLSSNRATKDVPITVLKNSNYTESFGSASILDYLLKQNLSPDDLYKTLKNSLRFKRTQLYLYQAYKRRKGQILKVMK